MNRPLDYYSILGVLPAADTVVIRAAYLALSKKYHPDIWSGEKGEASRRMQRLNEAYEVLSNPQSRERYDSQRAQNTNDEFDFDDETMRSAFREAETEQEGDWSFALEFYPDLSDSYKRLRKISEKLAFEYRSDILASKHFSMHHEIANAMERRFLERYFGRNKQILQFAGELIKDGNKKAAKELNRAVTVLGSNADPNIIIVRIREKHRSEESICGDLSVLARTVMKRQCDD